MPATNTEVSYGSVARSFHWLTALLILTVFPLGLYAESLPYATSEELAFKAQVFSIHKTLGIATFFTALARILWALGQKRPVPLHPGRRLETFAAELVHYALYLALIIVPLSGWISHAAASGFAPILWPFGDDLIFIPKSTAIEGFAAAVHLIAIWILAGSVALHVAGALKHVVIDRDQTIARMTRGVAAGRQGEAHSALLPKLGALAIYGAVILFAWNLSQSPAPAVADDPAVAASPEPATAPAPALAGDGNWQVESGSLGFRVRQMGSEVSGEFPDWTAEIRFDEAADAEGRHGEVRVTIDTTSLILGSVTQQAKSADFFDIARFPQAVFTAPITAADTGYLAEGSLSLRGLEKPVSLPFTLTITGDEAVMTGEAVLDRRDFGMGESYPDESSVGFSVTVPVTLTAKRVN